MFFNGSSMDKAKCLHLNQTLLNKSVIKMSLNLSIIISIPYKIVHKENYFNQYIKTYIMDGDKKM